MKIGGNLLKLAQSVIGTNSVQYSAFVSAPANAIGLKVSSYATAIPLKGNFQPVPRSNFQNLGLDFNKEYCKFYVSYPLTDLQRDKAGDRFVFGGKTYQVMSNTEWLNIDGWIGSMAVAVTP